VNGRIDGSEKALICIGGKVNCNLRSGCDTAGDFHIENHFAVGAVWGSARRIRGALNRHGSTRNVIDAETLPSNGADRYNGNRRRVR
jgi:hypothetical protein